MQRTGSALASDFFNATIIATSLAKTAQKRGGQRQKNDQSF
jgi:hypothetical protein